MYSQSNFYLQHIKLGAVSVFSMIRKIFTIVPVVLLDYVLSLVNLLTLSPE